MDKNEVVSAAAGRWRSILLGLCPGLQDGALDGSHQACPKCGGSDRFRVFRDFDERGGAHCNQCFADRNSDGFSFLGWWNGWSFAESLAAVAAHCGLDNSAKKATRKKSALADQWVQWTLDDGERRAWLSRWVSHRPPIVVESAMASEAMVGNWPEHQSGQVCVGFWGWSHNEKTALLLYRCDGQNFPAVGRQSERKTHLVGGSTAGWIFIGGRDRFSRAAVVWRVEGVPDGLALLPLLPSDHAIVTPATGCGWGKLPTAKNPPIDLFAGRVVCCVGDADVPGQRGVLRFAAAVESVASRVYLAELPYPVVDTHGSDLRDWIAAGGDYSGICGLLRDWSKLSSLSSDVFSAEGPEVCEPLRNFEILQEGDHKRFLARPMPLICEDLLSMSGGWPRRVGNRLFVDESHELVWLNNQSALFAWLGLRTHGTVEFARDGGVYSKGEVFEALQQSATAYKSVEHEPHEPPIEGHYYACRDYPDGDMECLNWLMDRFSPATVYDKHLILLMLATVFWGGPGGARPAFMITANGRGAGKTTLAMIAAELAGGVVDISQREDITKIKERLLTAEGKDKRLVLVDNIKATRLSWAELEALITCHVISGRELYKSESQRPNTLLWLLTMNGVGLSKDIAQRVVVIKLVRPEYSGAWQEQTMAYVREHRAQIIADLLTFLRGPRDKLSRNSRWAEWESQVLARLPFPDPVQDLILARQQECDVDADEADQLQDFVRSRLKFHQYDPADDMVFLPAAVVNRWYNEASGERVGKTKSTQTIKGWIEEGAVQRLRYDRHRSGRGFYWVGESRDPGDCDPSSANFDLEQRIEIDSRRGFGPKPAE